MRTAFIILILLMATAGFAQELAPLKLNPETVKELLLRQGLGIQMTELENEAFQQKLMQNKARFDTAVFLSGDHTIDKSARTSTFYGTRTDTSHWNAGLDRLFATGTTLGVHFANERKKTFGASPVIGLPAQPTYEPAIEFQVNQSIGKNLFGSKDRAEIQQTKKAIASFDFQTRDRIAQQLMETQEIFFQWALAKKEEEIGREARQASDKFLEITKEKEKIGIVEKTDLLGARALAAKQESLVRSLEAASSVWEMRLKQNLNLPKEQELEVEAMELKIPTQSEDVLIAYALEHRFDLLAAKQEAEEKNLKLVVAKKERWPTIDLFGSYRLNEIQVDDYYGAVGSMNSPKTAVGLALNIPLENRFGRGLKREAEADKKRSLLALKQLEQNIVLEVAQKSQARRLASESLKAREASARLEKAKLDEALKQYKIARFSSDLVLRYQDDYLNARREELAAKREEAKAILALQRSANNGL